MDSFVDTCQVEVPRLPRYQCDQRIEKPCIIGRNIKDLVATTGSSSASRASGNETTRIIGRVGLERFGRFQHSQVIYQVQRSTDTGITVSEVISDNIADHVTLQELERFENAQFEKELVFEDPLAASHQKKRGRPPKAVVDNTGISSDDETESDHLADGVAVVIPNLHPRKRRHSLSPVRARGRPRKTGNSNSLSRSSRRFRDGQAYTHVALPPVNRREKNARARSDSPAARQVSTVAAGIDAGSNQLILVKETNPDDIRNFPDHTSVDGSQSQFETSSALVAAALPPQSEDEDLDALHRQFQAKKPGRGRPRKPSPLQFPHPEDTDLVTLHHALKLRKPGRPRMNDTSKPVNKTVDQELSTTEDELSSLHQQFGVLPRKAARHDQLKPQSIPSKLKLARPEKPGPGSRPGYSAPSLQNEAAASEDGTTTSESSSASSTRLQAGVLSAPQIPSVQAIIEISSGDSDSSSIASLSYGEAASTRTPKAFIQSKKTSSQNARPNPPPASSKKFVKLAESDSEEDSSNGRSDDEDDEDEDMKALDFQIADVPSSQSYIAAQSGTSEDSDGGDRTIRPAKLAKIRPTALHSQNGKASTSAQSRSTMLQSHRTKSNPNPAGGQSIPSGDTSSSEGSSSCSSSSASDPIARQPSLASRTKGQQASKPSPQESQHSASRPTSRLHAKQSTKKPTATRPTTAKPPVSEANPRPFLPFASSQTKPTPTPQPRQVSSSPSDSVPAHRQ